MGLSSYLGVNCKKINKNDLWLVVPTANRFKYLDELFRNSLISKDNIVLIRTQDGPIFDEVINLFVKNDINIQKWWNTGINYAKNHGAKLVAVLNDAVYVAPGSLHAIAFEVIEQNAALGFPYPHSGSLAGYCWVLNLDSNVRPDERFSWWYGDNDLQMQAQSTSKYIYVTAEVRHLEGGNLTQQNEELRNLAKNDHMTFIKKWSKKPSRVEILRQLLYSILKANKGLFKWWSNNSNNIHAQ